MSTKQVGIICAVTCATVYSYFENEKTVKFREERLERLTSFKIEKCLRIESSDLKAQSELVSPIVITGLLKSWPAKSWSFPALRSRIGEM